jgi:hypothetical protein
VIVEHRSAPAPGSVQPASDANEKSFHRSGERPFVGRLHDQVSVVRLHGILDQTHIEALGREPQPTSDQRELALLPQAWQSSSHADRDEHRVSRENTRSNFVRHARALGSAFPSRAATRASARKKWKQSCSMSSFVCHRTRTTDRNTGGGDNSRNIDSISVGEMRLRHGAHSSMDDWGDIAGRSDACCPPAQRACHIDTESLSPRRRRSRGSLCRSSAHNECILPVKRRWMIGETTLHEATHAARRRSALVAIDAESLSSRGLRSRGSPRRSCICGVRIFPVKHRWMIGETTPNEETHAARRRTAHVTVNAESLRPRDLSFYVRNLLILQVKRRRMIRATTRR